MNVLFLSCWYPSKENPLKGIFVREHARVIHASGQKIIVLVLNVIHGPLIYQKSIEKFMDEQGIETHIIHIRSLFWKWIYVNPFQLYSILHSHFKKEILPGFFPEVIHSNILNPCAIMGDWFSSEYRRPHVITEHWSKIDKYMEKNLLSSYGRKAYENAKIITVVSNFLKTSIKKYVSDSSKIQVIPNVIDTNFFSYVPKNPASDKIVFTCIAFWTAPKQPMLFVKALEEICKTTSKQIELNMIGEGILLEGVRNFKAAYTINYHGNLPKNKIASILHGSDYFLHASDIETFSMVCAEALSTGTPVIASNVGGISELVNDSNGILTENTVPKWIEAIQKAINISYNSTAINKGVSNRFGMAAIGKLFREMYGSFQRG